MHQATKPTFAKVQNFGKGTHDAPNLITLLKLKRYIYSYIFNS